MTFVDGKTFGSYQISCATFHFQWFPIMRLNVQSSAIDWTYSGPIIEVLSVEPSERE